MYITHNRGYLIGLLTTLVMAAGAGTAHVRNATRADDVVAYATFAGIGVVAIMIAHQRYPNRTVWAFLVPAFIGFLAGLEGLWHFWAYALAFAVAGVIGVVAMLR